MSPIPKGTIRCIVRAGEERKIVHRSVFPLQTREDVVSGLHGMGVFRVDYLDAKWLLGFEMLSVDVDLERVTAPPEPPKVIETLRTVDAAQEPSIRAGTNFANEVYDAEVEALFKRVHDTRVSLDLYDNAVLNYTKQKHGFCERKVTTEEIVNAAELVLEHVKSFPELYLHRPDSQQPVTSAQDSVAKLAHLREYLQKRVLLIIGGVPVPKRIDWMETMLDVRPEWPETSPDGNHHLVASIERRIREGKIGAIIIANDLIRHGTFYSIRDAAAAHKVPVAYAAKCGTGQLNLAFDHLDVVLAKRNGHAAG